MGVPAPRVASPDPGWACFEVSEYSLNDVLMVVDDRTGAILILFYQSCSSLTKYKADVKARLEDHFLEGGQRSATQVGTRLNRVLAFHNKPHMRSNSPIFRLLLANLTGSVLAGAGVLAAGHIARRGLRVVVRGRRAARLSGPRAAQPPPLRLRRALRVLQR